MRPRMIDGLDDQRDRRRRERCCSAYCRFAAGESFKADGDTWRMEPPALDTVAPPCDRTDNRLAKHGTAAMHHLAYGEGFASRET